MPRLRSLVVAAVLLTASVTSHAYTECTGKVVRIWNDTTVWVWFDTGLIWALMSAANDAAANAQMNRIIALSTTAMVSDRSATVRFSVDNVPCTGNQSSTSVWGMYLNSQ